MPEKFLNLAQVGPHVEQMRRIAVTQSVRMNPIHHARFTCPGCENTAHIARTEPRDSASLRPVAGEGTGSSRSQTRDQGFRQKARTTAKDEVGFQRLSGGFGERYHAFLSSLARHAHVTPRKIDISHVESHEFTHP